MPEALARQTTTLAPVAGMTMQSTPVRPADSWRTRHRPWVMAFGSLDGSVVGHNMLISGSWVDNGPGEWRERSQIQTSHRVREYSYGVGAGVREATLTWQWVTRDAEYTPAPGDHRYGSITISFHQPQR